MRGVLVPTAEQADLAMRRHGHPEFTDRLNEVEHELRVVQGLDDEDLLLMLDNAHPTNTLTDRQRAVLQTMQEIVLMDMLEMV